MIAGGIDVAYPPENAMLQEQVATLGLLIAEQPPGVEPRARPDHILSVTTRN